MINRELFKTEIPALHPLSLDYRNFWTEETRRCIEGYWLGGTWMPPGLYFYINYGKIEFNVGRSNIKTLGNPTLRDIEWEFFYNCMEARGFSGFLLDDEYSCLEVLLDDSYTLDYLKLQYPNAINSKGEIKKYMRPRIYLRMQHDFHKGLPLYENEAQNILLLGSRDTGKSYLMGVGIALHQFLFDGKQVYTKERSKVEITVGAEDSQKSGLLLAKLKLSMDNLPGAQQVGSKYFPPPFYKQYSGSLGVGKGIIQEYKKKLQGGWIPNAGSSSTIKHRSFKDNYFADQGSRITYLILEEVGMFQGLKQVYANTKDNLRRGMRKTGTLLMSGTGGDMEGGTLDAYEMFYDPKQYQILPFEDIWEHKGWIGFFIPATMALEDQFKDENGFTIEDISKAEVLRAREKARSSKGSFGLIKEMQYRPLVPSEMFLSKSSSIFPVAELKRRLTEVNDSKSLVSNKVRLFFNPASYNGVDYEVDPHLHAIDRFPYPDDAPKEGAVQIFEFPKIVDGQVPPNAYIIGCDPFKDDSTTGASFASIIVMKTSAHPTTVGYDEIVATYYGRPYEGKNSVNEILHKLSLFYGNAKIYFENNVGNVKDYFERVKRLDLLCLQPTTVFNKKASFNTNPTLIYGYPMSNQKIKWEAVQYVRSWLLEERGNNIRNVDLISDPFLLGQLIFFSMDGNFDAVMGLIGCVIGLEEISNKLKRRIENTDSQSELEKEFLRFIVNNKLLFNGKTT